MSRTRHLTRAEADANTRPTRARAATRLTVDRNYFPDAGRPKNAGNAWQPGFNKGKRHRKETRDAKVQGRRLARRRAKQASP